MVAAPRLVLLDPRQLQTDPESIRKDLGSLDNLAQSIGEHGVLQPLGVVENAGNHQVVFGLRRREAAIIAGLEEVPCIVLPVQDEDEMLVLQVLENLQREDLNDMEKAEAFARLRRRLAAKYGIVGEQARDELVAQVLGLNERTVRRYLALRELAPAVRDLVADGALTVTQAQHLRALAPAVRQEAMARYAAEKGLTAAQISRTVALLARNANLTIEMALKMAEDGEEAPAGPAPVPATAALAAESPVRQAAPAFADPNDDSDLWDDEPDEADDPALQKVKLRDPATANGNRVFRVHSVDAFADLVERLAQCVRDGDITVIADQDEAAPMKLRLILRQLEALAKDMRLYLKRRHWAE